jgi:hypothetical protein
MALDRASTRLVSIGRAGAISVSRSNWKRGSKTALVRWTGET